MVIFKRPNKPDKGQNQYWYCRFQITSTGEPKTSFDKQRACYIKTYHQLCQEGEKVLWRKSCYHFRIND